MTIPKFPVAMIETGFGELQAAQSLAQSGKDVLSPGVTDTDGLILPQPAIDHLIKQTPLGRLRQPQDIADVVAFLVSDDAHWMTGQNLQVNGGIL